MSTEQMTKWCDDVYNAMLRDDFKELSKLLECDYDFTFEDMIDNEDVSRFIDAYLFSIFFT